MKFFREGGFFRENLAFFVEGSRLCEEGKGWGGEHDSMFRIPPREVVFIISKPLEEVLLYFSRGLSLDAIDTIDAIGMQLSPIVAYE